MQNLKRSFVSALICAAMLLTIATTPVMAEEKKQPQKFTQHEIGVIAASLAAGCTVATPCRAYALMQGRRSALAIGRLAKEMWEAYCRSLENGTPSGFAIAFIGPDKGATEKTYDAAAMVRLLAQVSAADQT